MSRIRSRILLQSLAVMSAAALASAPLTFECGPHLKELWAKEGGGGHDGHDGHEGGSGGGGHDGHDSASSGGGSGGGGSGGGHEGRDSGHASSGNAGGSSSSASNGGGTGNGKGGSANAGATGTASSGSTSNAGTSRASAAANTSGAASDRDAQQRGRQAVRDALRMNRDLLERAQRDLHRAAPKEAATGPDRRAEQESIRSNAAAANLGRAIGAERREARPAGRPADRRNDAAQPATVAANPALRVERVPPEDALAGASAGPSPGADERRESRREDERDQTESRVAAADRTAISNGVGAELHDDRLAPVGAATGMAAADTDIPEDLGADRQARRDDRLDNGAAADISAGTGAVGTAPGPAPSTGEIATLAMASIDNEQEDLAADRQEQPEDRDRAASARASVRIVAGITAVAVVTAVAAMAALAATLGAGGAIAPATNPTGDGRAQDRQAQPVTRRERDAAEPAE